MAAYNPLSGLLRTFDTYFVGAFLTREHAAVILFTFPPQNAHHKNTHTHTTYTQYTHTHTHTLSLSGQDAH